MYAISTLERFWLSPTPPAETSFDEGWISAVQITVAYPVSETMRAPPPGPPALVTPKKDAKLQLLFQGKSQWQIGSSLRSAHSVSPWNGRNCCSALRGEREGISCNTQQSIFHNAHVHLRSRRVVQALCLQTVCVCLIHITSHHIAICLPLSAAVW